MSSNSEQPSQAALAQLNPSARGSNTPNDPSATSNPSTSQASQGTTPISGGLETPGSDGGNNTSNDGGNVESGFISKAGAIKDAFGGKK